VAISIIPRLAVGGQFDPIILLAAWDVALVVYHDAEKKLVFDQAAQNGPRYTAAPPILKDGNPSWGETYFTRTAHRRGNASTP